jgi:hypothetical protein
MMFDFERIEFVIRESQEQNHASASTSELPKKPVPVGSDGVIVFPPGLHLWKLAEFFCTKKTYDSIFIPLLADFHHEYFDALSARREWRARWLRVLYCGEFFKSAGLNVAMRFLREAWARFHKA